MDVSDESLELVFQALDTEGKGHITVDQFISTFREFYQSTDLKGRRVSTSACDIERIVEVLDPQANGIIHFDDFKKAFQGDLEMTYINDGGSDAIHTDASPPHYLTDKSTCFSDGAGNKTDDSGVHLPETSYFDGDNDSVLSSEFGHSSRIHRDDIHRSWPKHRGPPYSDLPHPDSPVSGSRSDIILGDVENDLEMIRDQMRRMEQRVEGIHSSQNLAGETRMDRLRDENARLTAQITILEERLKEAEARGQRNVEAERQHMKTILSRTTREHATEVETLNARIATLQAECDSLNVESARIKAEQQAYSSGRRRDADALSEAQEEIRMLQEQLETIEKKHERDIEVLRNDRDHAVHVLEELNNSIGERRRSRVSQSSSLTSTLVGGSEIMARYQESQEIVRRLITENKVLRQQLEDAQDQLFARSLEEGQSLLKPTEKSWAAEIDNCTKEEVVEMYTKEKHANEQLRAYINTLIVRIMERHPSILEITDSQPTRS